MPMGLLIESSAHLKTCGCGEHWGRIVLGSGNMGVLLCSKQEAYHSLKVAVAKGLVSDIERQVVESQIDMCELPSKAHEIDPEWRVSIAMANMGKSSPVEGGLMVELKMRDVLEKAQEMFQTDSPDVYLASVIDADTFEGTPDYNIEGLPVC
jgi:hypothetical protein